MAERIEPTEDEKKNGWTAETLAKYMAERGSAQAGVVYHDPKFRPPRRPSVANGKYSPHRWRG